MDTLTTQTPPEAEVLDLRTLKKPSKRQKRFTDFFFNPSSETFGNVYQSAIASGFSDGYARSMASKSRDVGWIQELKVLYTQLEPEHIYLSFQQIAQQARRDSDKLRALELMAKIKGMFIERSINQTNVTFTNDVPRPTVIVDAKVD